MPSTARPTSSPFSALRRSLPAFFQGTDLLPQVCLASFDYYCVSNCDSFFEQPDCCSMLFRIIVFNHSGSPSFFFRCIHIFFRRKTVETGSPKVKTCGKTPVIYGGKFVFPDLLLFPEYNFLLRRHRLLPCSSGKQLQDIQGSRSLPSTLKESIPA